jgi:hypothetical protein
MAASFGQTFVGRMPEGLRGRVEIRAAPGGSSYAVDLGRFALRRARDHGNAPRHAGQVGRDLPRSKRPTRRTSGSRPRDREWTPRAWSWPVTVVTFAYPSDLPRGSSRLYIRRKPPRCHTRIFARSPRLPTKANRSPLKGFRSQLLTIANSPS